MEQESWGTSLVLFALIHFAHVGAQVGALLGLASGLAALILPRYRGRPRIALVAMHALIGALIGMTAGLLLVAVVWVVQPR